MESGLLAKWGFLLNDGKDMTPTINEMNFRMIPRSELQAILDRGNMESNGMYADEAQFHWTSAAYFRSLKSAPANSDVTASPLEGGSPAAAGKSREDHIEAMREFCQRIIKEYCWGYGEPNGGDIQDVADELGLIVPTTATAKDAEHMEYTDPGDTIYRFVDWLDEPRGLSAGELPPRSEAVNPVNPVNPLTDTKEGG